MSTVTQQYRLSGACRAVRRIANPGAAPINNLRAPYHALSPLRTQITKSLDTCRALPTSVRASSFHTTFIPQRRVGHNKEPIPEGPPTTDFSRMDMLSQTPTPATSVDVCMSDGFTLNSGAKMLNGDGALLVAGDAFAWRPWTDAKRLVNAKGQWEVPAEAFGLLGLVWPRPDLLILGVGPEIRPISPETRKYISSLGIRVEILDTRNAAAQFNLLATERGVGDVAAALIPIGWKEGVGAA